MISVKILLTAFGLLQSVAARNLPVRGSTMSKTINRHKDTIQAPAIPTSTLVSDFEKNNISAAWAEGYPKQWGSEDAKYEYPLSLSASSFSASISPDEKFIAMVNGSHVKIFSINSNITVSQTRVDFAGDAEAVILRDSPADGYDLFVSASNYSASTDAVVQIRLTANGTPTSNEQIQYEGQWSNIDNAPFSKNHRKFLTLRMDYYLKNSPVYVYDLDNAAKNLTLTGHTDWTMSAAFSPDGKYISTAAWDGTGKVWDANTGALIHTFGPFVTQANNRTYTVQNWYTNFSPDGKYLLLTIGGGSSARVNIYHVEALVNANHSSNSTIEPVVHISGFRNWIRDAAWSPDSFLLAIGEYGLILVYNTSTWQVEQRWEMENRSDWEIADLSWFDGNKRLVYRTTGGLELYDFEKNLKYRWGPGDMDHYNYGSEGTWLLKTKSWIGGVDSDAKVRFWKSPL